MSLDAPTLSDTARWLRSLGSLEGTPPAFDPTAVPDEPVVLFLDWLRAAVDADVPEPRAATLATAGADGIPDARTLILKDVDAGAGWAFAGPRASDKADQLAQNPAAALNFWWQPLMRAVRVRGPVVVASRAEIDADLAARPTAVTSADDWMVWHIRPTRVEFWQGAASREHIRLVYERNGDSWMHRVLPG